MKRLMMGIKVTIAVGWVGLLGFLKQAWMQQCSLELYKDVFTNLQLAMC